MSHVVGHRRGLEHPEELQDEDEDEDEEDDDDDDEEEAEKGEDVEWDEAEKRLIQGGVYHFLCATTRSPPSLSALSHFPYAFA